MMCLSADQSASERGASVMSKGNLKPEENASECIVSIPRSLKIAVLFFGHLRTFEKCAASVKENLLDLYACDVFMHTWSKTESETQTWHNQKGKAHAVDEAVRAKINAFYHPLGLCVEDQDLNRENIFLPRRNEPAGSLPFSSLGLSCMGDSLEKSFQLMRNSGKPYDCVVTLRPDIVLKKPLNLHFFNGAAAAGFRLCAVNPAGEMTKQAYVTDLASDIIQIAVPETMAKIVSFLPSVDWKKHSDGIVSPENLITEMLEKNGIYSKPVSFYYGRDWEIIRFPVNKKLRLKDFIRLRTRRNLLRLRLLEILPFSLFGFCIDILGRFRIEFGIGAAING